MNKVPVLRDTHGDLHFNHDPMTDLLANRFFAKDLGTLPISFLDDLPPHLTQPFPLITKEEVHVLLHHTSNSSAPGSSSIDWGLLKQGWPHLDNVLTDIYNACITLCYHPTAWKSAVVMVIPKLDKPNYSLPKAHHPISLFEMMSKLLEKVIAQHFQHNLVSHELVPTTQFGGHQHLSCL